MAENKKISDLDDVSAVDGTEVLPIVKGGSNFKMSVSSIRDWFGVVTSLRDGLMSIADKTKLNNISEGATANATDTVLKNRANHTGTQTASTISDLAAVATSGKYPDLLNKPDLTLAGLGAAPASHVGASGVGAHPIATTDAAGFMAPGTVALLEQVKDVAFSADYNDLLNTPYVPRGGHLGFSWFANSDELKGQSLNDYSSYGTGAFVGIASTGTTYKSGGQYHTLTSSADTYSIAGVRSAQPMVKMGSSSFNNGFVFESIIGWNYVTGSSMVIGLTDNNDKAYQNWGDGDKGLAVGWNAGHGGTAKLKIFSGDGTTSNIIDVDSGTIADAATYYINITMKSNGTKAYVTIINLDSGSYLADAKEISTYLPPANLPMYCMAEYGTLTGTASTVMNLFTLNAHIAPAQGTGMGSGGDNGGSAGGGTGGSVVLATDQQSIDGVSKIVAASPGGVAAWAGQFGIGNTSDTDATDLNLQVNGGNFTWTSGAANIPLAGSTGYGKTIARGVGDVMQLAIIKASGAMYTRTQTSATAWTAWALASTKPANFFSEMAGYSITQKKTMTDNIGAISSSSLTSTAASFDDVSITAVNQTLTISGAMTDHPTTPGTADAGILINSRRTFNAGGALVQVFISSSGTVYWRVGSGGDGAWVWKYAANTTLTNGWRVMFDTANLPSLGQLGAMGASLAALGTVDLNTLGMAPAAAGASIYYQTANAQATAARNYPAVKAGSLMVLPSAYGTMQIYTVFDTGDIWQRNLSGTWNGTNGPWLAWKKVASVNTTNVNLGTIAAATDLNTLGYGLTTSLAVQVYYQGAGASATLAMNYPEASATGNLTVIPSAAGSQQIYTTIAGNIYSRNLSAAWNGTNGPWNPWVLVAGPALALPYGNQTGPGTNAMAASGYTAIPFATETEDTSNLLASGQFTAPTAGLYMFEIEVRLDGGATNFAAVGTAVGLSLDVGTAVPTGLRNGYCTADVVTSRLVMRLNCVERIAAGITRKAYFFNGGSATTQLTTATMKVVRLSA